jgi:hypothetical protein
VQPRRDAEAVAGQRDRRLEQRPPVQPAVPVCTSCSIRRTPGTPTDSPPGTASGQGRGLPASSRNRCGVAVAIGAVSRPSHEVTASRGRVVMEQERAAAKPGRLRLDQAQHRLGRHRASIRAAACAQRLPHRTGWRGWQGTRSDAGETNGSASGVLLGHRHQPAPAPGGRQSNANFAGGFRAPPCLFHYCRSRVCGL